MASSINAPPAIPTYKCSFMRSDSALLAALSNFMLSPSLQCKLGDFGVSRLFELSNAAQNSPKSGPSTPKLGPRRDKKKVKSDQIKPPELNPWSASRTRSPMAALELNPGSASQTRSPSGRGDKKQGDVGFSFDDALEQTTNVGTVRYMVRALHGTCLKVG